MRDIIFRGKRLDNEEWVYGSLLLIENLAYIYDGDSCPSEVNFEYEFIAVDPATVGQYTGLRDRAGEMIWEGDLVKHGDEVSEVFFDTENSCFDFKASNDPFAAQFFCDYEILSNIHDHPDLLK